MKFVFIIQGEGRGHMTQAIAMQHLLKRAGHEVAAVCIGTSERREVPGFFVEKMGAPVSRFRSPNFVTDDADKRILIGATIWKNLKKAHIFLKSLRELDQIVTDLQPDLAINFYEPLWGLYRKRHPGNVPSVCVGHQFLAGHQDFPFPPGRYAEKVMLKTLNSVTAAGSKFRLCLSFTQMADPQDERLVVIPPLLRPAVFELAPSDGRYLLVYVMQAGYGADIISWHRKNPHVEIHCFWDRKGAPEVERHAENLTFHQLSDVKFLKMMAGCRGLVTTAGFESVCEAMYLGKPVFMVPVAGHYEQACNALDAARAGAGIWSGAFDLDSFMEYIPNHRADPASFRAWVDSAPERILGALERAVD